MSAIGGKADMAKWAAMSPNDPKRTLLHGRISPPGRFHCLARHAELDWFWPGVAMRRREFIAGIAGSAAWPFVARAQEKCGASASSSPPPQTMRNIKHALAHSSRGLRNWAGRSAATCGSTPAGPRRSSAEIRRHAAELAALAPDVILVYSSPALAALQEATRTVPIVFVTVIDPVGSGFVDSLARPGGNTTGFMVWNTV